MKKVISVLIMVLFCCTMLVGCSDKTGENNSNGGNGTAEVTAAANKDYFEWSEIIETKIVGYSAEGLKQTELVIPKECTSIIGLEENSNLKSVSFENPDTEIGSNTFRDCTSLEKIELPSNLKILDDSLFSGCSNLKSIILPYSVTEVGNSVFSYCTSLKEITFGSDVKKIGNNAFDGCASLETISLPNTVSSIGKWAFRECTALKEVVFCKGIITIEQAAFQNCANLEVVKLEEAC